MLWIPLDNKEAASGPLQSRVGQGRGGQSRWSQREAVTAAADRRWMPQPRGDTQINRIGLI